MTRYRGLAHLGLGVLVGLLVGAGIVALGRGTLAWLLAWSTGALCYAAVTWLTVWRLDPEQTRARATAEDVGRPLVDVAVLAAAVVSITVIGFVLVGARPEQPDLLQVVVGIVAIASTWLALHTMFWVRYARRYYSSDVGGMDFHDSESPAPRYSDFAYVTFTVAMTFQVSDTDITNSRMRRAVLGHALTSFFFVTVILAVVINLVGGLAG